MKLILNILVLHMTIVACQEPGGYELAERPSSEKASVDANTNKQPERSFNRDMMSGHVEEEVVLESFAYKPDLSQPELSAYALTVQSAKIKPLTDLHLIVDNSYSMAPIQAQTAATVRKLLDQVVAQDLNLDVRLYTTTDMESAEPSAVSYLGSNPRLQTAASGTEGLRSNFKFGQRTFFSRTSGIDTVLAAIPSAGEFWVRDLIVPVSPILTGSGISNGVLSLRQGQSSAGIQTLADRIANLGTDGSDTEQHVATMLRIVDQLEAQTDRRQAFAIVTNEEDMSRKALLRALESEIVPQNAATVRARVRIVRLSMEYMRKIPATFRDGVQLTAETFQKQMYTVDLRNCKTNALCGSSDLNVLKSNRSCDAQQYSHIANLIRTKLVSDGHQVMENPSCSALAWFLTTSNVSVADRSVQCSSINPATGKTYTESFQSSGSLSSEVFDSTPCEVSVAAASRVKTTRRDQFIPSASNTTEVGTEALGDLVLSQLHSKVGAKGYSVALIAQDGSTTCQQANGSPAVRLQQFLAKTATPTLSTSVCSNDYWSVVGKGLLDFIQYSPVLRYAISFDPQKITKIYVNDAQSQTRELSTQDYTISGQTLEFRSGSIAIQEELVVMVQEDAAAPAEDVAPELANP